MDPLHPPRVAAVVCAALVTAADPAATQTVEGLLFDRYTHAPVIGALIVLIDPSGARVATGLTSESGGFSVRAPTPGAYAVKVERIGYRSWTTPPRPLRAGEVVREDLTVSAVPLQLDAIVVEADDACRVRPAEGQAAAVLWEEARKALSAADWADREGRLRYVVTQYERELDASLRVREERLTGSDTVFTRAPFVGAPAAELAERGYVRVAADGSARYLAPDAHALLSDAFLDGHCFRVRRGDRRHRAMVGLAFGPARGRDFPDIDGVLWLDSATAELRTLEFGYTSLHLVGIEADDAGGFIEFRRVASGHWVVREWWIRMPLLTITEDRRHRVRRPEVEGYRIAGGRVSAIITERGTRRFDMGTGLVTGTVSMGAAGEPLAGVEVSLEGTAYAATTDELGRFRIADVSPGRYAARAAHTAFLLLGTPRIDVEVRHGDVTTVQLVAPSVEEITTGRCDAGWTARGSAVLAGVVRSAESGAPVPDATVEVTRLRVIQPGAPPRRGTLGRGDEGGDGGVFGVRGVLTAGADGRGTYVLCGLPAGIALVVRAVHATGEGEPVRVEMGDAELRSLDLGMAPRGAR